MGNNYLRPCKYCKGEPKLMKSHGLYQYQCCGESSVRASDISATRLDWNIMDKLR